MVKQTEVLGDGMPSSEMFCRMDVVRTDVSEECCASIIRVTRIAACVGS
jgi:hypothetical protein